jgi:ferric-dicitrate binding protein FerR (iron transport regulator)
MAGEATESELHELDELLSEHPDAIYTEDIFAQIWNSKVKEEDVNYFYRKHKKKYQDQFESTESLEAFAPRESWLKKHRFAAAAIFTFIALTSSAYYIFSSTQKTITTPSEYHIVAGKGIRKAISLPDGTKVWLNGDSKLTYNAKMNEEDTRLVSLTGEAFFDVAHDKEHPFIIRTDKVSIKVLGTAFNISAYPNDKKCETTLLRGSIELTVNDN